MNFSIFKTTFLSMCCGCILFGSAGLAKADIGPMENPIENILIGSMLKAETAYQYADYEGLRGTSFGFLLGLPVAEMEGIKAFLEAGFTEVRADQPGLPITRLLVGSRIAWLWEDISLHMDAHFGYGEQSVTKRGTIIDIGFVDLGFGTFYDVIEYEFGPKASLGIFCSATGHRTVEAGKKRAKLDAVSLRGGLALAIW